tara:strand:- start:227 stop:598 length:372 start_codon:yes stop_codon:yes gene_type:complete
MAAVSLDTDVAILSALPERMLFGMARLMLGRNAKAKVVARMAIADVAMAKAKAGAEAIVTAMEMTTEVMGVIPDPMASVVITPLAMVIVVLEIPANSFIQVRREADEATEMAMAIPTMVMHLS